MKLFLLLFEITENIQFSKFSFYYNRLSISANDSIKPMGNFGIKLLVGDKTSSTRNNIPKNNRYSNSSTQWTMVSVISGMEIHEMKLNKDQIDIPHADMCFSSISITHSVL